VVERARTLYRLQHLKEKKEEEKKMDEKGGRRK
jgi:hypothetical protein